MTITDEILSDMMKPKVIGSIRPDTDVTAVSAWRRERKNISASAFQPKSHLTLSEWSDRHRWLSTDTGNGGQWRTDRVPYLRRPMDAITDPLVRRVTMMKSARIGATQGIVVNTMFYCVDQDPCAIIVGLPTIDDALKFSSKILQPAIDDTAVVADKIAAAKSRKRRSTMLERTYAGGSWQIIGTKSPRAARMVHGRYILKSEIDAWEGSAGSDGDPYNLIDKRAGSYDNPKFIEESTPLVRETSRIEPAFLAGSEEYYFVPCPHCDEFQRLVWGGKDSEHGLKWGRKEDGSPDLRDVYYVCEHNGCEILETEKNSMVARGEWRAMHPDRTDHLSFHLNALVSPFDGARWPVLVDEWYKTERKPEKVRVFVNTVLGETYVEDGEQADGDTLTQRRDEGTWFSEECPVPEGAAVLTRSVDTQGDRLETAVWAWGDGEECWLVDWELLPGDPTTSEPWDALDERIGFTMVNGRLKLAPPKSYRHAGGRDLVPRITLIDAGGHHSAVVKSYAKKRRKRKVHAIFGANQQRAPIAGSETRSGRYLMIPVGSFAAKEALIKRIEKIQEPGPGYLHLPSADWMTDELIEQLTAEKLVTMGDKRVFKKMRARNELTDLWVYGLAGLYHLGDKTINSLGLIARKLMPEGDAVAKVAESIGDTASRFVEQLRPKPEPAKRPRRGGFINRWR